MVVDTSAIMAILLAEEEAEAFDAILLAAGSVRLSVGSLLESYRVLQVRADIARWAELDALLEEYEVKITAVDAQQLHVAREGMERFGMGRGASPAVLNFGDLFAYALARTLSAPLLFKGDEFVQTDVIPAWRP